MGECHFRQPLQPMKTKISLCFSMKFVTLFRLEGHGFNMKNPDLLFVIRICKFRLSELEC